MSEEQNKNKLCPTCGIQKLITEFFKNSSKKDGLAVQCCICTKEYRRKNRDILNIKNKTRMKKDRLNNIKKYMIIEARKRSKQKNIPFSITEENIVIPDVCPILGIPIIQGTEHPTNNSPSLDRIIPSLGYVPENIRVISHRANTIKRDMTLEECALLFQDFKKRE